MNINRTFAIMSLCVLLIGASLPLTALALAPRLPPPPPPPPTATSTPTPTPTSPSPTLPASPAQPVAGATIQLLVQPASEAVWQTYFWQDLWTVVQWQGFLGRWYDVTGWQGNLDQIVDGAGQKTWWLDEANFSRGPFRWVIYQNQGGRLLAASASFYLPDTAGSSVTVEIELEP